MINAKLQTYPQVLLDVDKVSRHACPGLSLIRTRL